MIEIRNLTKTRIEKRFFEKIGEILLRGENRTSSLVSLVFVGESRMRFLNKKYRGQNAVTDVLAFSWNDSFSGPRLEAKNFLGEVILCPGVIKKNAKLFNLSCRKELALVFFHGLLHLFGYEHEKSKNGAKAMEKKQNFYLSKIKFL